MYNSEKRTADLRQKLAAIQEEISYCEAVTVIQTVVSEVDFKILPEHHERFFYYHEPIEGYIFENGSLWFGENADHEVAIEAINRKWENMYFCEIVNVAWVVPLLEATKTYFALREKYK